MGCNSNLTLCRLKRQLEKVESEQLNQLQTEITRLKEVLPFFTSHHPILMINFFNVDLCGQQSSWTNLFNRAL